MVGLLISYLRQGSIAEKIDASGVVVIRLELGPRDPDSGVCFPVILVPLYYWVSTLGQLVYLHCLASFLSLQKVAFGLD